MEQHIFRKKSIDRIASPEQLEDYLHVTGAPVWVLLISVLLLLVGLLIWSGFVAIESYAVGTAYAENQMLTVVFEDENTAQNVMPGMSVIIGEKTGRITSVGRNAEGQLIAGCSADVPDGRYEAKVGYRRTQLIRLLFR